MIRYVSAATAGGWGAIVFMAAFATPVQGQSRAVDRTDPNLARPPLITTISADSASVQVGQLRLSRVLQALQKGDRAELEGELGLEGAITPSDTLQGPCGTLRATIAGVSPRAGQAAGRPLLVEMGESMRNDSTVTLNLRVGVHEGAGVVRWYRLRMAREGQGEGRWVASHGLARLACALNRVVG